MPFVLLLMSPKEVSPGMRLRALLLLTTLVSIAMIVGEWGHGP